MLFRENHTLLKKGGVTHVHAVFHDVSGSAGKYDGCITAYLFVLHSKGKEVLL